jgi:hypothetical protein
MTIPHDLLNDLRSSTAVTRTVEAMILEGRPYVMIPRYAVTSWETSDAVSVGKVAGWLTAQNVAVVQV